MEADQSNTELPGATNATGRIRLAIGFLQGIVAWLLLRLVAPTNYGISTDKTHDLFWSERHPLCFAAIAFVTAFVPALVIAESGRMRRARLWTYALLTSLALAALAVYDVWRDPLEGYANTPRIWPSFQTTFCAVIGLFIVNQLLEHRERGYNLFSQYAQHFEDSWMRGFQLIVSLFFTGVVWGVLELGAALFALIHITWVRSLIEHDWFRCPVLAMAFAAGVHLTDVRPALLQGVRNVGLTLLSWLLPLITLIAAGFLVALAFVGMQPLWATHRAAGILLWSCALMVFFLNAAYKDGNPLTLPNTVLRFSGRAAGPVILLLAAIAAYALGLRVHQYGMTNERVLSAAVAILALTYGAGYTYATFRNRDWLRPLESVNVTASLIALAILILILSPVADPYRLSVNSQVSRLTTGTVAPDKFDYRYLRFESGEYGRRALAELSTTANGDVRTRAVRMQALKHDVAFLSPTEGITDEPFAHATVYPPGTQMPDDFKSKNWAADLTVNSDCLKNGNPCDIYLIANGTDLSIIVRDTPRIGRTQSDDNNNYGISGAVFQRTDSGWKKTGTLSGTSCPQDLQALKAGQATWARPDHDDLLVNGTKIRFTPSIFADSKCPKKAQPAPPAGTDPQAPMHMGPGFGQPSK